MTDQSEITTTLALPADTDLPALYSRDGEIDRILERIEAEARTMVPDLRTARGRKEIKSLAYRVARSKTALDEAGKRLNEDKRRQIAAVDAERQKIRSRLDSLKDEIRKPVDDWEAQEEQRKAAHRERLAIFRADQTDWRMAASEISAAIERAEATPIDDSWEEFREMAREAQEAGLLKMRSDLEAAEARERQEAELARLKAEQAERERQEREEAERRRRDEAEAERKRKAEEAEQARLAQIEEARAKAAEKAQERAEREAEEARLRYEREIEKARKDAEAAAERERQKIAEEHAEEEAARKKRQRDKAHRERVLSAIHDALSAYEVSQMPKAMLDGKIPHVRVML